MFSPGRDSFRALTRAPASATQRGLGREHPGSSRSWCKLRGAQRKKNSYFQAQFLRLKARHGAKKAAIAVAASILTTVYHMLRDGTCYQDLGPEYFTRRNPAQAAARLANRIRNLGYHVEIRAAA